MGSSFFCRDFEQRLRLLVFCHLHACLQSDDPHEISRGCLQYLFLMPQFRLFSCLIHAMRILFFVDLPLRLETV